MSINFVFFSSTYGTYKKYSYDCECLLKQYDTVDNRDVEINMTFLVTKPNYNETIILKMDRSLSTFFSFLFSSRILFAGDCMPQRLGYDRYYVKVSTNNNYVID